MRINYTILATLSAALCSGLALVWMCAPDVPLMLWDIETSYPTSFVGRRCGALFAALGIMLWLVRHSEPSAARKAMSTGIAAGCFILAALGLGEFFTQHANAYILPAVLVEMMLAVSFLMVERGQSVSTASQAPLP